MSIRIWVYENRFSYRTFSGLSRFFFFLLAYSLALYQRHLVQLLIHLGCVWVNQRSRSQFYIMAHNNNDDNDTWTWAREREREGMRLRVRGARGKKQQTIIFDKFTFAPALIMNWWEALATNYYNTQAQTLKLVLRRGLLFFMSEWQREGYQANSCKIRKKEKCVKKRDKR